MARIAIVVGGVLLLAGVLGNAVLAGGSVRWLLFGLNACGLVLLLGALARSLGGGEPMGEPQAVGDPLDLR